MPLDNLQRNVLRHLTANRTPDSVFAGGSVLHRHAYRLSDDQDIFHAEHVDVAGVADRDIGTLKNAGFTVEKTSRCRDGFIEAEIGDSERGFTRLQWVQSGLWNFFQAVPDPDYGFRLHMVDLAINKVLAAAGRREVRDFVDLALIHRHLMPLWHALWAAPGKDAAWTPMSLAERIAATNAWRQEDVDAKIVATVPLSAAAIGRTVRAAIDEARDTFPLLPRATAGNLFVTAEGDPTCDLDAIRSGRTGLLAASRGGGWPSGPDVDHALIQAVIDAYGIDGYRALAASESP